MTPRGNSPDTTDIDIEAFIDAQPIGFRQICIVILVLLVMMFDGMDLQLLGLAAPRILKDWGLQKAMLGPALAMTVVGMGIGAFLGGWLGDRLGRKPTMVAALCLIGFATVACGFVGNVMELAVCRFVCGIGGGACFPGSATLIAEWLPRRKKSLAVGIITVGIPLGGMLGAVLVIVALALGGWRDAFLVGGLLPLGLAIASYVLMPESLSWLAATGRRDPAIRALIHRIFPMAPAVEGRFVISRPPALQARAAIFGPGDRRTSLGIWLAFYMNVVATSGIVTWGTVLLTVLGFPIAFAVSVILAVNLAAAGAMLACALLTTRFGSKALFLFASISAIVLILAVSIAAASHPTSIVVVAGIVAAGALLFMNQTLLYIIASQAYPVEKRSTGVGLASLVSRFGSTTSALVGGVILSLSSPLYFLFFLAGVALLAGVGALIIDRHVNPGGASGANA